jgi:hypothetical protein
MAARLTSDGSLETSFADGGIAVADVGAFDFGQGMAIGSFEDVIVAGYTSDAVNELLLVRFLGSFPAKDFADDDASVFEADIESLATAGITRGCNPPANDEFCPDDPVTRGQMAAFLVRALDYADGGGNGFVDDDNSVFEADIARLAAARVTLGCNPPANDRFCPDDPVTRGQMAAFLRRALDGTLAEGPSVEFVDTDQSVFADDVAWLGATGVTLGCNPPANDRFCPDDPVTRGQMAAFLVRALDLD